MRREKRSSGPFVVVGILFTALLHLAVLGGFWLARASAERAPMLGPGSYVDAQLVKFGRPRDLSFLPHKQGVVKTQGPPRGLKIATDAKAPAHFDKKEEEPDKIDPLKTTHSNLFKSLKDPDAPEGFDAVGEGSPTGSKAGTATEARGDPYILELIDQIGSAWKVPTTIRESELGSLKALVCLTIDASGALTHVVTKTPSTNSQFNSSLEAALATIKRLPPPPPRFLQAAQAGRLCAFFTKQ